MLAPCTSGKAAFSIGGSGYKHEGEVPSRIKLAEIAHRQEVEEQYEEIEHGLHVVTANTTSWGSAKLFLFETKADVVMIQEHKLTSDLEIATAVQYAKDQGWTMVIEKAAVGLSGNAGSAGVAVLARSSLRMTKFQVPTSDEGEVNASRFVAAQLEISGYPCMMVASIYLKVELGITGENLDLLTQVARVVSKAQIPTVVGGDWNAAPRALMESEFVSKIGGQVFVPKGGTCTAGKEATTLDYYVVTQMSNAVESVHAVKGSCNKTHRPVEITFIPRPTEWRMRKVKLPQKMGMEVPYGPMTKPMDWKLLRDQVEEAYMVAMTGTDVQALLAYDNAYGKFADLAERELARRTNTSIVKWGARGREPHLTWAPVVEPPRKPFLKVSDERSELMAKLAGARDVSLQLQDLFQRMRKARAVDFLRRSPALTSVEGEFQGTTGRAVQGLTHPGVGGGLFSHHRKNQSWAEAEGTTGQALQGLTHPGDGGGLFPHYRKTHSWAEAEGWDLWGEHDAVWDSIVATAPAADWLQDEKLHETIRDAAKATRYTYVKLLAEAQSVFECLLNGSIQGDGEKIEGTISDVVTSLRELEAQVSADRSKEVRIAWKNALSPCGKVASKRAFMAAKLPEGWMPAGYDEAVKDQAEAKDPLSVLDKYRRKFARLWKADPNDCGDHIVLGPRWGGGEALPRLTPKQLKQAARLFKASTATTFDGFSPRGFEHLSDEGLGVLATLMQITECLGTMPPSARTVSVALIPKATGGHRPVCIGTAYMRLYSRARSPIVSKWEDRFRRPFLASAKATGAIDAVWRQAVDAEEAVEQGGHAAAIPRISKHSSIQ